MTTDRKPTDSQLTLTLMLVRGQLAASVGSHSFLPNFSGVFCFNRSSFSQLKRKIDGVGMQH